MKLTSEKVENVFNDCLFREDENTSNHIKAEGIMQSVGFHPDRLNSHKEEIIELLNELPEEFKRSRGGGWSFLQACVDRNGNQWTDLHLRMEQLFLLGIAIGMVVCQTPRSIWKVMPGGMPHYVIEN